MRSFKTRVDTHRLESQEAILKGNTSDMQVNLGEALDIIHEMAIMLGDRHCSLDEMEEY